ncbi:MAG: 16S rRNA (guanine(966)-N(2))-methyltransferase RsmD [Thermodesulfobacteriota bacterium]
MSLKIIGGRCRGRSLVSPRGMAVRPTAGRVREAIFNILFSRIDNAVVLDLFAGTGAMGIEALSRGAARAVFVDSRPEALAVIRQNLQACGLSSAAGIIRQDATRNLSGLVHLQLMFDIVFMDPPYNRDTVGKALAALAGTVLLKPGSMVVLEHSPREPAEEESGRFHLLDQRRYGQTVVSFLEYGTN